jgi:MinD superfamily P-loop ATPase
MKCKVCKRITTRIYYDDYRPEKLYAYYQCKSCGACFYKCPVHKTWTGDRPAFEDDVCTCREE